MASGREDAGRAFVRRWRRRIPAVILALFIAFIAVTARVLVWPAQGAPPSVNAILMLDGPGDRMSVALKLASQHRAPVLVVSLGGKGGLCPPPIAGVRTICFVPSPGDTRGEVEYAARLSKRYGWHSLLIVATRPQAMRAQLLMGRCFTGSTYVVTAPVTWYSWPYQITYGWGALAKALTVHRSCLSVGVDYNFVEIRAIEFRLWILKTGKLLSLSTHCASHPRVWSSGQRGTM
jgi:uncharacterized SAM-binding protein YcdF (DUF218 family)